MQVKARVIDVYRERVTIEAENTGVFENNIDKELILDIKGQGRSLNANSYFHLLSDKIAEKLHTSKPEAKNMLMSRYGQKELDENGKQLMFSVEESIPVLQRSDIHCEIKGYGHVGEKTFIHYGLLRPTHTYTRQEMALLIDGTVQDALSLGIETIPPQQLQSMIDKWREHK